MNDQLAAVARLHELLEREGIEYWLFGGWAVDFHAGRVTRAHDDLDLAVWRSDYERVAALLAGDEWEHSPAEGEDGYTTYQRGDLQLELAFLARGDDGHVYTPLSQGRAPWPERAFEAQVADLHGVRARVMSLAALKADKAEVRDVPRVAAKDRVDSSTLAGVEQR